MANSGSSFRDQHNIDEIGEPKHDPTETPEDLADEEIEGAEIAENIDTIHNEAFGDKDDKSTITEEINKDEIVVVKNLTKSQQTKK